MKIKTIETINEALDLNLKPPSERDFIFFVVFGVVMGPLFVLTVYFMGGSQNGIGNIYFFCFALGALTYRMGCSLKSGINSALFGLYFFSLGMCSECVGGN